MFYIYCTLFFIYSFLGWVMEIIFTLITEKKLVNRGFLLGPYCPIYGCGCLLLTFLLKKYTDNFLVLFILTFFICSLLEYITSYFMEKIFKLRWWDYTQMKYNLNGRICLETMTPFSLLGSLATKYLTPLLINTIIIIPKKLTIIILTSIITLFIIDLIISFKIILKIKLLTKNTRKDNTIDIKKAINNMIKNDKYIYTRIIESFPNLTKNIKEKTFKLIKSKK